MSYFNVKNKRSRIELSYTGACHYDGILPIRQTVEPPDGGQLVYSYIAYLPVRVFLVFQDYLAQSCHVALCTDHCTLYVSLHTATFACYCMAGSCAQR